MSDLQPRPPRGANSAPGGKLALGLLGLALVVSPALAGCNPEHQGATSASPAVPVAAASGAAGSDALVAASGPADYAHANELGLVPVMEYHRFGPKEERWTRTPANFRQDLEFFYNNGYHLVNARDLALKHLDVPAGKKPLVLTFDDATDVQFRYLKGADGKIKRDAAGKAAIDPDCAVGMLDAFYARHPDFGRAGTFYVLPSGFEQEGVIQEKFKYLNDTQREIANHTWSHDNMAKMSVAQASKEVNRDQRFIRQQLGDSFDVVTMALPFGIGPRAKDAFAAVVSGGTGPEAHHFRAIMLVGANPSLSPYDRKFNPEAVPRIQGIDSEYRNWFNRKPGSTAKVTEPWTPYVSDGDPTRVTFPPSSAKRFNPAALLPGQRANPVVPGAKTAAAPASTPPSAASSTTSVAATATPAAATASPATQGAASAPPAPQAAAGSTVLAGYHNAKLPTGGLVKDGKLFHKVKSGDAIEDIAYSYLRYTDSYTYPKLASAIRQANHLEGRSLKLGELLEVPGLRQVPPSAQLVPVEKGYEARGIYVTGNTSGSELVWKLVAELKAHGGNTVVFDAKDMNGVLTYASQVPLAQEIKAHVPGSMITDMPKFLERLHKEGIHAVARLACFHDQKLAVHRPQYALKSKHGGVWRENGDLAWVDASLPEVQDYNLALAKELVAMGVDEIQFDYVRFPAMGDTQNIVWSTIKSGQPAKSDVITAWVKKAHEAIAPSHALLSADVYGVVAWDQGIDVRITGQKLEEMSKYLDAISPMLYPSHFYSNFDHFTYPPDHPDYFISEGVKRTAKKTAGTGIAIRPWLQAFPYRIHHYGPAYVTTQLRANNQAKANGWLLWNAENDYRVGFEGVEGLRKPGQVASAAVK